MFRPKKAAKKAVAASVTADEKSVRVAAVDFAALRVQADRAFKKAAKSAVAENDALGIATHGATRGKLVVRAPAKRRKPAVA